jgi:hypothetical protein
MLTPFLRLRHQVRSRTIKASPAILPITLPAIVPAGGVDLEVEASGLGQALVELEQLALAVAATTLRVLVVASEEDTTMRTTEDVGCGGGLDEVWEPLVIEETSRLVLT